MPSLPPLDIVLAIALALFLGIGIHEYAHCNYADLAGDPTPRLYGRVTLNLTKHFESSGVIMMVLSSLVGYGLGWGKPAPCDDSKMRNPRWDGFMCAAAGPISNLLQASLYALVLRLAVMGGIGIESFGWFGLFLYVAIVINIRLALFNLIPFSLLDGHWLLGYLMPEKPRFYWFRFNRRFGLPMLFVFVIGCQIMQNNLGWSPFTFLVDIPGQHVENFLLGPVGE